MYTYIYTLLLNVNIYKFENYCFQPVLQLKFIFIADYYFES